METNSICKKCLVGPICSTLCEDRLKEFAEECLYYASYINALYYFDHSKWRDPSNKKRDIFCCRKINKLVNISNHIVARKDWRYKYTEYNDQEGLYALANLTEKVLTPEKVLEIESLAKEDASRELYKELKTYGKRKHCEGLLEI